MFLLQMMVRQHAASGTFPINICYTDRQIRDMKKDKFLSHLCNTETYDWPLYMLLYTFPFKWDRTPKHTHTHCRHPSHFQEASFQRFFGMILPCTSICLVFEPPVTPIISQGAQRAAWNNALNLLHGLPQKRFIPQAPEGTVGLKEGIGGYKKSWPVAMYVYEGRCM